MHTLSQQASQSKQTWHNVITRSLPSPLTQTYSMDLQQQAHKLQRQMVNREKRRAQDGNRKEEGSYDDNKPRKKRAEPLKAAQQAYAAVMAAAALTPQPVQRCELCQAAFVTEAQLQQHLDGPVHKKAVEKAAREAAKQHHINQHSAVAQEALAAAAWLGGGSAGSSAASAHSHRHLQSQQQQQLVGHAKQQKQGKRRDGRQQGPSTREEPLTHEQVLAAAKHDSGPLSLDGWVPPSVPTVPAAQRNLPTNKVEANNPAGQQAAAHDAGLEDDATAELGVVDTPAAQQEDEAAQGCKDTQDDAGDSTDSSGSDSEDDDAQQSFESFF